MDPELQEICLSPKFGGRLLRIKLEPPDAACLHEQGQVQEQYRVESPSRGNGCGETVGTCHIKDSLDNSSNERGIIQSKTEPYNTALLVVQDEMGHRHDSTSQVTVAELVHMLAKGKVTVADSVLEGRGAEQPSSTRKAVSDKAVARNVAICRKRKVLSQQLSSSSDDGEDDDDDYDDDWVPKRLLLEEQRKVSVLRQKLHSLRQKHEKLQVRHDRLEDIMLGKLESWSTSNGGYDTHFQEAALHSSTTQFGTFAEREDPVLSTRNPVLPLTHHPTGPNTAECNAVQGTKAPAVPVPERKTTKGVSYHGVREQLGGRDQPVNSSSAPGNPGMENRGGAAVAPALFVEVDGQVHLGNNVFVPTSKWQWLQQRTRDSLFCKEVARAIWGTAGLKGRSVTGTICRRFVNTDVAATAKRALTPSKLEAVGNAFDKFIEENSSTETKKQRRAKMNRYIAEMLQDMNK
ncbi:uncharacterized protein LOC135372691 isoform X2 [Ornithodoros turicata]|uniref:uncharacterized protein LOC135372691 isoform X2 n=1 Tax=Ornithodoros turicata TaxID=34597 RepID=UPI0031399209